MTGVDSVGDIVDVRGDNRLVRVAIGYDRQRGGEELVGSVELFCNEPGRLLLNV